LRHIADIEDRQAGGVRLAAEPLDESDRFRMAEIAMFTRPHHLEAGPFPGSVAAPARQPFHGSPMTCAGPGVGAKVGSLHEAALTGTLSSIPIVTVAIDAAARMMASDSNVGVVWRAERHRAKGRP